MVDMHNHVLWGIDDGSKDESMTLEMLEIAVSEGIHTIITTPHYIHGQNQYTKEELQAKLQSVQLLAAEHHIDIKLIQGNEVYIDPGLDQLWEKQEFFSMGGSKYVLVEFPMLGIPSYAADALYRLQLKGLVPIIAHPERYPEVQKDPNILYDFIEKGCLAQMNAGSMTGLLGNTVVETAKILFTHHMIHFIGTDAHTNRRRAPKIREAYEVAKGWIGETEAAGIFDQNPQYVIEDKSFPYISPKPYVKQKRKAKTFFKQLFGR